MKLRSYTFSSSFSMKAQVNQFVIDIGKFALLAVAIYISLLLILGELAIRRHLIPVTLLKNIHYKHGIKGRTLERLAEVKSKQDIDILFLGSSHAFTGFDTRIFREHGYRTFNLGTNSQTPLQTRYLIERYLVQLSPKLIIYETYPAVFTMDGVESALDILSNEKLNWQSAQLVLNHNNIKVLNTALFSLYMEKVHTLSLSRTSSNKNDTYIGDGYVEPQLKYYRPKSLVFGPWILKSQQLTAFEEVCQFASANKIPILAVQAPISRTLRSAGQIMKNLIGK